MIDCCIAGVLFFFLCVYVFWLVELLIFGIVFSDIFGYSFLFFVRAARGHGNGMDLKHTRWGGGDFLNASWL